MSTFIGQLIGFAVIVWLLWRFVVPPIKKLMADQQESVRKHLAEAAAAADRLAQASQAHTAAVAKAEVEAKRVTEDARADAVRITEQLRAQAGTDAAPSDAGPPEVRATGSAPSSAPDDDQIALFDALLDDGGAGRLTRLAGPDAAVSSPSLGSAVRVDVEPVDRAVDVEREHPVGVPVTVQAEQPPAAGEPDVRRPVLPDADRDRAPRADGPGRCGGQGGQHRQGAGDQGRGDHSR